MADLIVTAPDRLIPTPETIDNSPAVNVPAVGPPNGQPTKTGFQKRIDKITRQREEARQEAEALREENTVLKEIVRRYDAVIERYKIQLLQRRHHVR
jgi:hypothetical protein